MALRVGGFARDYRTSAEEMPAGLSAPPCSANTPYLLTEAQLAAIHDTIEGLMETLIAALISVFRATIRTRTSLVLEYLALRQQVTIYRRNQKQPRLRSGERFFIRRISGDHPEWGEDKIVE